MKYSSIIFFYFSISNFVVAQQDTLPIKSTKAHYTKSEIILDGQLTEDVWDNIEASTEFWEKYPSVKLAINPQSKFKIAYDDNNIYIAAICYQNFEKINQSLKRDQDYWDGDGIGIILDPYDQKTLAYFFGTNPAGAQTDALIVQSSNFSSKWDAKWEVSTSINDSAWIAEFKIPFRILKFSKDKTNWGINVVRNLTKISSYHTWNPVPLQFEGIDIGYLGTLQFDVLPKGKNVNVSLIPYVKYGFNEPKQTNFRNWDAGLQSKLSFGTKMNLDLAINPDFSQVDIDQQVTNLTRFSVFLPENRTFFLENSDLFGSYGTGSIKPFYSRTIGIDQNGKTEPILIGARLTGNLNKTLRLGLMNMTTASNQDKTNTNYGAVTLYQNLWSRSRIKGILLNKQSLSNPHDYSRNTGIEFTFIDKSGTWLAWTGYHRSIKPNFNHKSNYVLSGVYYNSKNHAFNIDYSGVGTNYYTDQGYILRIENYDISRDTIIRKGFNQFYTSYAYQNYYGDYSKSVSTNYRINNFIVYNPDMSFNERNTELSIVHNLKNFNEFGLELVNSEINLPFPFQFVSDNNAKYLEATKYLYNDLSLFFNSGNQSALSWNANTSYGSFYNGHKLEIGTKIAYRFKNRANASIDYNRYQIKLADGYGSENFNEYNARLEFYLSKKLFFTNFVQYIDQINRFSLNSRLQWTFSPLSDLYLVYVDNYNSEYLKFFKTNKDRNYSLVLKLNYWFDL